MSLSILLFALAFALKTAMIFSKMHYLPSISPPREWGQIDNNKEQADYVDSKKTEKAQLIVKNLSVHLHALKIEAD